MIEEITFPLVQGALRGIKKAKQVELGDDVLTFTYRDTDGDDVPVVVTIESEEKLFCTLLIPIPEAVFVTAIICANLYNLRSDAHGTFAYATQLGEEGQHCIALETHILTRGGISESFLKYALRNFLDRIDLFEGVLIPAINELGPDGSFMKSSGWSSFWEAAGAFFRGYSRD